MRRLYCIEQLHSRPRCMLSCVWKKSIAGLDAQMRWGFDREWSSIYISLMMLDRHDFFDASSRRHSPWALHGCKVIRERHVSIACLATSLSTR